MKKNLSENYLLTDIQKDTLTGNLLGDGSLSKITKKTKNSLFEIKQKLDKSEYIQLLFNIYRPFFNIIGKINKKNNKPLIVFCGDNAFNLMELTKCFIPDCYKYKTLNRLSKYNSRIHNDKI